MYEAVLLLTLVIARLFAPFVFLRDFRYIRITFFHLKLSDSKRSIQSSNLATGRVATLVVRTVVQSYLPAGTNVYAHLHRVSKNNNDVAHYNFNAH